MRRLLLIALATIVAATWSASAAEKSSVLGKVLPEIRLANGTVFKKAKIVAYSLEQSTATIAEPARIRVVPLNQLPPTLRDQILTEAGAKPVSPNRPPARKIIRPFPAPTRSGAVASTTQTEAAVATTAPALAHEELLRKASATAPDQLQDHLTRTYGRVGSLSTRVVETREVFGWPRIRVSGETSFTERAPGQRSSSLHREKFEVEFLLTDSGTLKPDTVTVGGIAHPAASR